MKFLLPLLAALALLPYVGLRAQAEAANNWHFGRMRALTFTDNGPVANLRSAMQGFEGVVSMSDANGNLLFYTNGGGLPEGEQPSGRRSTTGIIWNRNHEVMYDMRGLEGGGWSARQSSIAMPDPSGEEGVYYLFTMEESDYNDGGAIDGQPLGRGLSYFVIDMKLNGGLGGVRLADQRVFTPTYEGLDATPMADSSGYWIVCHEQTATSENFILTPLTAAGVGEPVSQPTQERLRGRIKFSPDGQFLYCNGFVYAFNDGRVGELLGTVNSVVKNTVTFTPDSRFIYALEEDENLGLIVARYEVPVFERLPIARLSPDQADAVELANGPIQIGPNDKLYFLEYQSAGPSGGPIFGLSEIECPSTSSPTVNRFVVEFNDVAGPTEVSFNLPAYVDAIFSRPYAPDTLVLDTLTSIGCAGESLTLEAETEGTGYSWSTGDTSRSIAVTDAGLYCVTVSGACQPTVACSRLTFEKITVTIEAATRYVECSPDLAVFTAVTMGRVDSLRWESGETTDTIVIPIGEAVMTPRLTAYGPCGTATAEFTLEGTRLGEPVMLQLSPSAICPGDELSLSVSDPDGQIATYRWFDGSTSPTLTVEADEDTDYFVELVTVCGDSLQLDDYTLEFLEDCNCEGVFPELVSPNGDRRNDVFRLFTNCTVSDYTLLLYDRWGQEVFNADRAEMSWDGTVNGTPKEAGVYLYRAAFRFPDQEETQIREGQFFLVR